MVRFFSLKRRDQPYLGEMDFHSSSVTPCSVASQPTSSFQVSAEGPRAEVSSAVVGLVVWEMNALGRSTFFLSLWAGHQDGVVRFTADSVAERGGNRRGVPSRCESWASARASTVPRGTVRESGQ